MSKFRIFCIALLLTASSALSQDVRYDVDDTADFSNFKTYKWITLEKVAPIDELSDQQIKATLDAALARKGFSKVDGDSSADLLIGYQTTEQVQEQFSGKDPITGIGPGVSGPSNTWTIYKGDLAVSMYDGANHKLIWRGVASKTVDPKAKPEKRQKNLDKAVAKLMKNYPPPTTK